MKARNQIRANGVVRALCQKSSKIQMPLEFLRSGTFGSVCAV